MLTFVIIGNSGSVLLETLATPHQATLYWQHWQFNCGGNVYYGQPTALSTAAAAITAAIDCFVAVVAVAPARHACLSAATLFATALSTATLAVHHQ